MQGFGNIDIPTNELSVLKAEAYKHHLSTTTQGLSWFCSTLDCLLVGLLSFQWKHPILKQLALLCWNLSLHLSVLLITKIQDPAACYSQCCPHSWQWFSMDKLGPAGSPRELQITFSWGSHLGNAACRKHSRVTEKPPDQLLLPLLESQASTASAPGLTSVPGSWRTSSQPNKWMPWYSTSTAFHWALSLHLHYHWTLYDKTSTLSTSNAINMSEASFLHARPGLYLRSFAANRFRLPH